MKILHLVRSLHEALPLDLARRQAAEHEVTVLLLHDAVYRQDLAGLRVWAGRLDAEGRGVAHRHTLVDDQGILDLVAAHDRVFSW